jgi:hypothetical protein
MKLTTETHAARRKRRESGGFYLSVPLLWLCGEPLLNRYSIRARLRLRDAGK